MCARRIPKTLRPGRPSDERRTTPPAQPPVLGSAGAVRAAAVDHSGRPAGGGSSEPDELRPHLARAADRVRPLQTSRVCGRKAGMRRGSLFAPLLLIGLGALFLARNIYPDLPLLDYLARYWPFLLILWGVLRLGEILIWASTGKPLPARGVSGGEWILVLVLCFFGGTLHAAMGLSSWLPRGRLELGGLDIFGETYDYPITAEKPAAKAPHILIESFRGNARISGMDASAVKVTGREIVRSMDQDRADRAHQNTGFEIAGDENNIIIRTNQDRAPLSQRVTHELEISVPKG